MEFNKLVRDKIPAKIEAHGEKAFVHIASDAEYKLALEQKLQEEIAEFLSGPCVEEMADILEVLRALGDLYKVDYIDLEKIRQEKFEQRGGFSQRIILEKTE